MLGKLIKHEFKATARRIVPMLLIELGLALIAGYVLPAIYNSASTASKFFYGTGCVLFVLSVIAAGVVAFVLLIQRFRKHILGDEGYSTMTLPVTVHEILWSKMIVFFVWFAVVLATALLSIFFVERIDPYQVQGTFRMVLEIPEGIQGITWIHCVLYALEFIIYAFVAFSASCLQIYASLMIGQQAPKAKLLCSVLVYIAFGILISFITVMLTQLMENISPEKFSGLTTAIIDTKLHLGIFLLIVVTAIPGVIYYLITAGGMKKHLNLE